MGTSRYEIQSSEKLGRYLVAAKDLRPGEKILTDEPFIIGPHVESALVCFKCHLPLLSKFVVCKNCAMAPVCPGEGCEQYKDKWHTESECNVFRDLKLKGFNAMTMVQNVGSLIFLRTLLKRDTDPERWNEFMQLETHLDQRRGTDIWRYHENTEKCIQVLGLLKDNKDRDLVQKICAAIDVNSFEVRGPAIPAINCAEVLRGVYLKAALLAHDCVGNTHMSINDNNVLVCHASTEIKKGEPIYFNYTDPLKGTAIRQQHLMIGKYFKCSCRRCSDSTEMNTHLSSAKCKKCKIGLVTMKDKAWSCDNCQDEAKDVGRLVQCCIDKLGVINKRDENELEEYIRNVSLVLAPTHYLLLDAKQRLAGVLRDAICRELRPNIKLIKRQIQLCSDLLPVLDTLSPGISRITAITMYELHAATVQLARRQFDAREINGSTYMDELVKAEKYLKRALEMLFIEPGNSPEGELCAKALEDYRGLKDTMNKALDALHAEGKAYVSEIVEESS